MMACQKMSPMHVTLKASIIFVKTVNELTKTDNVKERNLLGFYCSAVHFERILQLTNLSYWQIRICSPSKFPCSPQKRSLDKSSGEGKW